MRIVLADDHRVVREGIRYMLEGEERIDIVAEAESGEELLTILESTPADVVLLDVRMPGMGGLEALEAVKERHPEVRVLMLSMYDQPAYLKRAVASGASGYLLKSTGRDELLRALDAVAAGGAYLQGDLMQPLVAEMATGGPAAEGLSPREREVLQAVADGLENKQIARHLGISEATVKTYLRGVFEHLEVTSRAEAVAVGLRLGLIE